MRKIIVLMLLATFACKSNKPSLTKMEKKNVLLQYSKGPCLGKCPVYDFYVLKDGTLIYKEINRGHKTMEIEYQLTPEEVSDLVQVINDNLTKPTLFRRIRDLPVTILRFDDMEYEYHAARIEGPLKQVNAKLEDLVGKTAARL